jgi:5'-nucleotidase
MRLLIDLDGTIAHFDREYDRHLTERYAHLTNIPRSHEQVSFNLWEGRTPEEQEAIRDIMNHPGFYRHLEPMEGAVDAVFDMEKAGHEVFFATAPWRTNRTCLQDKADWIADHFGEEKADQIVFAKKKFMLSGDILFDDKYPVERADEANWVQVFVHQPYNANATGLRIHGWNEWPEIVDYVQNQKSAAEAERRLSETSSITIPLNLLNEFKYVEFSK